MKINVNKTKVQCIRRKRGEPINISLENERLDEVEHFKYLGSLLSADGTIVKEVRAGIVMAKAAFERNKRILTSKTLRKE